MTALTSTPLPYSISDQNWHDLHSKDLLKGEVLLKTRTHSAWGGAVTAQMYLPLSRANAWEQLTDYPRWVQYFPALTHSEVLSQNESKPNGLNAARSYKRLHQAASKTFLFLTAQVDIYLKVVETVQQQIQFRLESGSFTEFTADLKLRDYDQGTLLTYSVAATPTFPVPSLFIQQAIQLDLPSNMKTMRQVLCNSCFV